MVLQNRTPIINKNSTLAEDHDDSHESRDSRVALPLSAADRRAAFHSSKTILSASIERRPPLVRAMSAPIRTTTETKTTNKRRPIRRRHRISRERSTDDLDENSSIILQAVNETPERDNQQMDGNNGKSFDACTATTNAARSKPSLGVSDVITLVSLLSSGGSDSEKDEPIHCVSVYANIIHFSYPR